MSSKLYDILDKLTPDGELGTGTGNYHFEEQKVLLWENASPSSAFPEQTITVSDLSDYDEILIEGREGVSTLFKVGGDGGTLLFNNISKSSSGNTGQIHERCIKNPNNTSLDVGQNVRWDIHYDQWGSTDNVNKPYFIYGIKKIG